MGDTQGGGREDRACACPHLMLIYLDGLDFLGCAEVCGGRTVRSALLAPVFATTFPSNQTLTYPKVARLHPHHPTAPQGSAPAVPGSGYSLCGPGEPAAGGGPVSGGDPGRMPLLPFSPDHPAPWPAHCEGPSLKVHGMQLTVSPCQDERILL